MGDVFVFYDLFFFFEHASNPQHVNDLSANWNFLFFGETYDSVPQKPRGELPIMAYTGRLRPKGVPFLASGI